MSNIILILCCSFLAANNSACKKSADAPLQNIVTPVDSPKVGIDGMVKTYLALGDSYTIGQSVDEADRFPVQTAALLNAAGVNMAKPEIIAITGWTTGSLLNAVRNKPDSPYYSAVSLLIGVNNQYQRRSIEEYKTEFTDLLQKSIKLAGNRPKRVFVLSVPDYSVTPFVTNPADKIRISAEIDAFNDANKTISSNYGVNYLDITAESRKAASDPSLIASDNLHFSGKAYAVWANMLSVQMRKQFE